MPAKDGRPAYTGQLNRAKLQKVADLRVREARALLQAGCAPGAYYLSGYIIECALKACIAKQTRRYDFPNRKLINMVHTHDLEQLMFSACISREGGVFPWIKLQW